MHVIPPKPDVPSYWAIMSEIIEGRLSRCCVCENPCGSWWSEKPPQRYVPLHTGRCVTKLLTLWEQGHGGEEVEDVPLVRAGAYARRSTTTVSTRAHRTVRGETLPDGFTPGPFWQPGDGATSPWTVAFETASGRTIVPCSANETHARHVLRLTELRKMTGHGKTPVVGGALVAPDGSVVASFGDPVKLWGPPRWSPVSRLSDWKYCSGCEDLRWPGSWMSIHGAARCLDCLRSEEVEDPRPQLVDAPRPDPSHIPERFTKSQEKHEKEMRKRIRRR